MRKKIKQRLRKMNCRSKEKGKTETKKEWWKLKKP